MFVYIGNEKINLTLPSYLYLLLIHQPLKVIHVIKFIDISIVLQNASVHAD